MQSINLAVQNGPSMAATGTKCKASGSVIETESGTTSAHALNFAKSCEIVIEKKVQYLTLHDGTQ